MSRDPNVYIGANMTYAQVSMIMEKLSKVIQEIPSSVLIELDETSRLGLDNVARSIVEVLTKLKEYQETFNDSATQVYHAYEDGWVKIKKAKEEFEERMKSLKLANPDISIPNVYGLNEFINVAERCSRLTDGQWRRVIQLAQALAKQD